MRAVALLGPHARERDLRPFELPGVNLFAGNELDPTDEPEAALIFGGDGTVHRHLGSLALKKTSLLVVPAGSANDFAQSIGIRSAADALAEWKRFCEVGGNTRLIDLGTIARLQPEEAAELKPAAPAEEPVPWQGESLETLHFVPDGPRRDLPELGPRIEHSQARRWIEAERAAARTTYFACIAGTGLDAAVNRRTLKQSPWLRSHGGYVLALVQELAAFRPPSIAVSLEIDGHWQTPIREPGMLIAAGNGPQYGDGMRLTHRALMNDGMLDVCFVRQLSKLRLLRLFHVVFRGGHIGMKEVEYFRASRVRLQTDPVSDLYADGEYIGPTPVELGIAPKALRVIAPA